jgi:HEPN domain-containing protein
MVFFAQLALGKALKAHICSHTLDLPPRIHNLVRLAELSGIEIPSDFFVI